MGRAGSHEVTSPTLVMFARGTAILNTAAQKS
jgi:hypothetical protein